MWFLKILLTFSIVSPSGGAVIQTGPVQLNDLYTFSASSTTNNVFVISNTTNAVVATIPVAGIPFGLTLNPTGSQLWLTIPSTNQFQIISTSSLSVIRTQGLGGAYYSITFTPNGAAAYISNPTAAFVAVVNTSTFSASAVAMAGITDNVAATADSQFVYVTIPGLNEVQVIATATNTITATIAVGATPNAIVLSPDGLHIYVGNKTGNSLSVITISSNTVTATIAGLQSPQQMVSSPTKSLIYVSAGTSIIYVINTATNVVASVLALPFYQSTSIAISSDGNTLYVVGTAAGAGPGTLVSISTTTFQILESVALVDAPVTLPANGLATTPFYVSKSSPIFVNDPNSGPQSNRVQCMNNSGQNLSIQCGGFNYFVAPYSVATFDTRRSSTLAVGWSGTNVNSAGYASFNWLTPRDEMPIADGPLSAQGVAGAIG